MHDQYQAKWGSILHRLGVGLPNWQERINNLNQAALVQARAGGHVFSNDEVFKGLVLSVLSSSTNWAIVENILPDLAVQFAGFQIEPFTALDDDEIEDLYSWFIQQHAGSVVLRKSLLNLRAAARALMMRADQFDSLHLYLENLLQQRNGNPRDLVVALGGRQFGPKHKLPGLGIALAAEFLKNVGYDVAKPDRHVNRAVGSFGWVEFNTWPNREGTKAPTASEGEAMAVMDEMEHFADANALLVCYVDNAVWLLCAQSGLHLSNHELAHL